MFHTFPPVRSKGRGFTLVELIVVITILAILSTISFITYTNMSSDARNSVRKTDMGEMKVRLRGIAQKLGAFPLPSSPITLSNSGTAYVSQGWSDTIETDNGSSFRADPKTNRPYLYATTTNRQGYQVGMILEQGAGKYSTYVDGDYTPLAPYVFPSLLLATTTTGNLEIHDGIGAGTANRANFIVNNGTLNLPYDINGRAVAGTASTFSGVIQEANVRLPWSSNYSSCQAIYEAGRSMGPGDYLVIDSTGALTMTGCTMVQVANSCAANPSFTYIGTLTTGSPTSVGQAWTYNAVPGNCTYTCTGGYSGSGCATAPVLAYSSSTTYTASQQFTYNGATITVSSTGIGTSSTKADAGCDTNDIAVWQGGTNNVQVWAACNMWASTVTGYGTVPVQTPDPTATSSALPPNRVAGVQGNYYQWGRNDNVTSGTWTASQWGGAFTSPANTTGNTNFYQGDANGDWKWGGATNPAGGWNTGNGGDNQWNCSAGYHIPTGGTNDNTTQWGMLYTIINSTGTFGSCSQSNVYDRMACVMKMSYAGYRSSVNGQYYSQGTFGYYWSSTPNSIYSNAVRIFSGGGNISYYDNRGHGYSLRCVKN